MELPKDWARIQNAYEEEEYWRRQGELAIRQEMERRLADYFAKKAASGVSSLSPLPRLVPMGTTGHINHQNRVNRDRAQAGLPRQRDLNQQRREAPDIEDIRRWRVHPSNR